MYEVGGVGPTCSRSLLPVEVLVSLAFQVGHLDRIVQQRDTNGTLGEMQVQSLTSYMYVQYMYMYTLYCQKHLDISKWK